MALKAPLWRHTAPRAMRLGGSFIKKTRRTTVFVSTRYAESNTLLEGMMARDKRFAHAFDASVHSEAETESTTVSDRVIKDLLLF